MRNDLHKLKEIKFQSCVTQWGFFWFLNNLLLSSFLVLNDVKIDQLWQQCLKKMKILKFYVLCFFLQNFSYWHLIVIYELKEFYSLKLLNFRNQNKSNLNQFLFKLNVNSLGCSITKISSVFFVHLGYSTDNFQSWGNTF